MKFQVFKDGKLVNAFDLCGAYLFGSDGIAVRNAPVAFKNGLIECDKPNLGTSGLALLWPVKGFGQVLLQTTCLPERETPYNLNLELARAKLMQIINKREDWSFFSEIESPEDNSKDAKNLFIKALQNISDAPLASKLADAALEKAVIFSEQLADKQAQLVFDARAKSRGFGRGCLGCRIDPMQMANRDYAMYILKLFGVVMVPISWAKIEQQKGVYDFSELDNCIETLAKMRLVIGAGPLVYFAKENIPAWLLDSKAGFGEIRDAAFHFAAKVVEHYSGKVRAWNVVSNLNMINHFNFSFEQVLEMTRAATMAVRASDERSVKIIEITNPWGEYYSEIPNTVPPLVYFDMIMQSGISFDVFGLAIRFGRNEPGLCLRDMIQISSILDNFGLAGKPMHITNIEIPGEKNGSQWDMTMQGKWIEHFYKIAFSKPFIENLTYTSLADTKDSIIANSGLLTDNLKPKESYHAIERVQKLIFGK